MTREELIDHLEHLERYTHYSEDAPALREVIEMLKCSEIPNSSDERTDKRTGTHACDLIERETARRIIDSPRSKEQMLRMLEATPPAQADQIAEVNKKVDADLISRQAVLSLPSAQPEITLESAIDYLHSIGWMQEHDRILTESAQPAPQWIPCSERLPDHPENNDYYLVTIQCEHYDGWDDYVTGFAEWTEHGWDELSCYIGQIKDIAWMPLPEPYQTERREDG